MAEIIEIRGNNALNMPEKTRVCAYARVSSDSEEQVNSFISQVDHYTKYIEANPQWEYVDIYADEGLTATKIDKREEFLRMLDDCKKGKIDKILTKSVSRFARNTKDCLKTVRELQTLGVEVIFEKENIHTMSMSSETMLGIYSSIAQEESISMSKNMRMSYKRRMESGEFNTCFAPFGYRLENAILVIDQEQAKIVRRVFNEFINGKSKYKIAQEFTSDKIVKTNGKTNWDNKSIDYILKNERYMGDALLQKRCSTDTLPFRKIRNHGEKQQYYVQNANEPIIPKETFEKARMLIEIKARQFVSQNEPQEYPLSKMICCKNCGTSFRRKNGNDEKVFWVCRKRDVGKENCDIPRVEESKIIDAFVRMFNKLKMNEKYILSPIIDQLQKLKYQYNKNCTKLDKVNKEIAELTEQNLVISRLKAKGYMDSAIFIEQCNEINSKIQKLRKEKRQFQSKDYNDFMIDDTKKIIEILQNNTMYRFDETILKLMIKKIIAGQNEIKFILINGLEIKEKLM